MQPGKPKPWRNLNMTTYPQVIYLGGKDAGRQELDQNLRKIATVMVAEAIPEMLRLVESEGADVVLCEWSFPGGTWREAVAQLRRFHPHLPAIVISQTQGLDEGIQEWLEVLSGGAFDLLLAPSNEYSVRSMMEHAFISGEARAMRTAV
jgi:DNA-binding NtrC family response regulator